MFSATTKYIINMASPLTYRSSKDGKLGDGPPRKKLKTSELPLSSSTRTTIDVLSNKFKKKGGYDALRNEIWKELEGSVCMTEVNKD